MFVVNMTFISSREVKKIYISFVPSALMKYTFFHFTRWNKSHIHSKHLNILYLLYTKTYIFTPLSSEKYKIWNYFALVKIWMFSLHEMKIFMVFTEKE